MCRKPNKTDFEKFLITHWVIWVQKMQNINPLGFWAAKNKRKRTKKKNKNIFYGLLVKGLRF